MGIFGFHVICCTYGFWLPNDQRGSKSDFIRKKELLKFGDATYIDTNRSVACNRQDPEIRRLAQSSLKYPTVLFNGKQAHCVALAVGKEIDRYGGEILAFAVLPTHFHFVAPEHRYGLRRFAGRLKGAATAHLRECSLHPLKEFANAGGTLPSPWGRLPWVRYLWNNDDMLRAIEYVENNPMKEGKRRQYWSFVTRWGG